MIAGLTKGDKAVKAEKTSDQLKELSVAEYVVKSIHDLQKLHKRSLSKIVMGLYISISRKLY